MPGRLSAIDHHDRTVFVRNVGQIGDGLDRARHVRCMLADEHACRCGGYRTLYLFDIDMAFGIDRHSSDLHTARHQRKQRPCDRIVLRRDDDDPVPMLETALQHKVEGRGASRLEREVPLVGDTEKPREFAAGVGDRPTRRNREGMRPATGITARDIHSPDHRLGDTRRLGPRCRGMVEVHDCAWLAHVLAVPPAGHHLDGMLEDAVDETKRLTDRLLRAGHVDDECGAPLTCRSAREHRPVRDLQALPGE